MLRKQRLVSLLLALLISEYVTEMPRLVVTHIVYIFGSTTSQNGIVISRSRRVLMDRQVCFAILVIDASPRKVRRSFGLDCAVVT